VRAAARWLADQPFTLPDYVADRLDVVLAHLLDHKLSDARGTCRKSLTRDG
jgi:hypothetical protein